METIIVKGSQAGLKGQVEIEGAKNAVLPLLAATVLASKGQTQLTQVPILSDVFTMNNVVRGLGVRVKFDEETKTIDVDATGKLGSETPYKYVSQMRASIVILGPILARNGYAKVSMPGGCTIGSRPIDLHLKGLQAMGARIKQRAGYIEASAEALQGAHIYLDFPSVGATQNLMMAATLAHGMTILENAAQEPEIIDLANFLNIMGAKIRGAGTNVIKITGVPKLIGHNYTIIPDRIEAGTYMVAVAMTGGDIYIENAISEHLKPVIAKLNEAGVKIEEDIDGIRVSCNKRPKAIDIKTLPYPGFPTDMQAQFMAMLTIADGTGLVTETVFENRFMHVDELKRMGACIKVDGRTSIVEGVPSLNGCQVKATDLRAGAAMVLAGLVANGETEVSYIHHIDRGYDNLVEKLCGLGADICRVDN